MTHFDKKGKKFFVFRQYFLSNNPFFSLFYNFQNTFCPPPLILGGFFIFVEKIVTLCLSFVRFFCYNGILDYHPRRKVGTKYEKKEGI